MEDFSSSFSFEQLSLYTMPRIVTSTALGSLGGASAGYYIGQKTAVYFYTFGLTAGIIGAGFFSGVYTIKSIRGKDDIINFAASGALTGGTIAAIGGRPLWKGLVGAVVGTLLGSTYRISSSWLYLNSRELWISNRKHVLQNSVPKSFRMKTPNFNNPINPHADSVSIISNDKLNSAQISIDNNNNTKK